MSPLWSILLVALLGVNLSLVEAGKKYNQDEVIVINNNGGGKCGGHTRTIVKTAGQGKKGKGKKGKGHKIILSSGGGKCPGEHKVTHIPFPMPVPHYEHVHHPGGWGGHSERRDSGSLAAGSMQVASMTPAASSSSSSSSSSAGTSSQAQTQAQAPATEKGDRGMMFPAAFQHYDQQRMDMPYPAHMDMAGANPAAVFMPHPYAHPGHHHLHHQPGYGPYM